ncbi:MAG: hypothetical protein J7J96_09575, partial [Sulfurimonas sp.]|nr:hypothetical protein [Sulfurimonas sp.]
MTKKLIILTILIINIYANTSQEQQFLEKIANEKNLNLLNSGHILNNELKIQKVVAKENYTLDIKYKVYFNNLDLTDQFKEANL